MRIILSILGLINGGYMTADGIYVLLNGKYIGPEKPGPWAEIFYSLGIDVFRLGPLFIVFGMLWLSWAFGWWKKRAFAFNFGIVLSILTLWYLPVGTLISIIILLTLVLARRKMPVKR